MSGNTLTMSQQVAQAARNFQLQRTGHEPRAVNVILSDKTLVITLHGALTPAEQTVAREPAGAAQVQEFHRQLFASSAGALCQEIKRITGVEVREAAAEVEMTTGTVVHAFTSGTMVQVFLLTHNVSTELWNNTNAISPLSLKPRKDYSMNDFVQQPESSREFTLSNKRGSPQSGPSRVQSSSHGDIARRAYDIYLKTGRKQGQCEKNWQQAERDLHNEAQTACATHECGCGAAPAAKAHITPVMKSVGDVSPATTSHEHAPRGVRHPVPSTGHGAKA